MWDAYFKSNATAENDLEELIAEKQIHVALDKDDECIGIMGIVDKGCFHKFSYLSLIAVKEEYRGKGVGNKMLLKFEEIGFEKSDRVFLLVSDFNRRAQMFYQKWGYRQVGKVPDLFKAGIAECIMVKYKS